MDWQPSFIALLDRSGDTARPVPAEAAIRVHAPGLVCVARVRGLSLFARSGTPVSQCRDGNLIMLGHLYDRTGAAAPERWATGGPGDFPDLLERWWGRYLAFRRDPSSRQWDVLRDPSGALSALLVEGAVGLVADELPGWLLGALDIAPRPDRRLVANALAVPTLTAHRSLLIGVTLLPAGAAARWDGRWSRPQLLWRALARTPAAGANPDDIRDAVLTVGRALANPRRTMVVELSGGLDSAIVLAALATAGTASSLVAVNIATPQPSGDERGPARDAAARWGVELVEVAPGEGDLDYSVALAGPQPGLRNAYGLDCVLERSVNGICEAFDADMILTGQGGDAVLFQFPTERVAYDLFADRGLASLFSRAAIDVARRTRVSIWRLASRMLASRWRGAAPDRMPATSTFLTRACRSMLDPSLGDHPWIGAAMSLPPGKRIQAFALANCQWFNGPAARRQRAQLVHPLLAQPVVEACLAMPTYALSYGTQDRALARALFADMLPASIARRRFKGETSAYYRRAIVHNLPYLRELLLDGCLVSAGLLDNGALEAALDENALIWRHDVGAIVSLASIESWSRHWGL